MPLIKNGEVVPEDWGYLSDEAPLPSTGAVFVSLARWQAERDTLRGRNQPIGVVLPNDADPKAIADDLPHLSAIALVFPKYTDGRAYSQARLLRERYGFSGQLRATGNVLRDQLLFMHRSGFDAYEIARPDAAEVFRAALAEMTLFHQPTGDGRATILQQRLARRLDNRSAA
ncbi:DUF934 domain-containing protein [Ferrovibrio sp.]|uniref:DUF934 domain-containing protein n=1 Tax=Ferrovibrio sp. TaxID=1917215 RepID=UPI0025BB7051|nr:DUF934 domain-containing protein [Ferrovibrio sp.]MBX3454888.1 DUF934 domain-containing protein [Ferrovibrio sp.]